MNLTKEKKKLILKYIIIVLIVAFFINTFSKSYAFNGIIDTMKPTPSNDQKITTIGNEILGIIQFIGVAVLLGSLITLGIISITNINSKKLADLKDGLVLIIVGAALILAPVTIVNVIYSSAKSGVN